MANEISHNFDTIMNEAIIKSGSDNNNPLDEETLKVFLTNYHFDRRTKKTTEEVKKLNPEADETYVSRVYNQLFDLRDAVDKDKKSEGHRDKILQQRIEQLQKDFERIAAKKGKMKIPRFNKNQDASKLNVAAFKAIQTTGLEGPLDPNELGSLIIGFAKPLILEYRLHSLRNEGRVRTVSRYFVQVQLVQQFPEQQQDSYPIDTPEGKIPIEDVINQLKQLRSRIVTNKKNEKHDFDFIYERLEKAIDGLRTENGYTC